jgi:hypothetical protein
MEELLGPGSLFPARRPPRLSPRTNCSGGAGAPGLAVGGALPRDPRRVAGLRQASEVRRRAGSGVTRRPPLPTAHRGPSWTEL